MAICAKTRRRGALIAVALLAAIAVDGYRLQRASSINAAIERGAALALGTGVPPAALFAQARELEAKGDRQGALALYKRLQRESARALALAARYNSGNVYLRQALQLSDEEQRQLMVPLTELAKESYRAVLRADPLNWDAKYNLERALRLVPEADDEAPVEDAGLRNAERAVTTMRGISLGLP